MTIPSFAKKPAHIGIGLLALVIIGQHIQNRVSNLKEAGMTNPAAISIGKEIDDAGAKYVAADKAIQEATKNKADAAALAQAKRVELCAKFGMTYAPGQVGSTLPLFQKDANCPLN